MTVQAGVRVGVFVIIAMVCIICRLCHSLQHARVEQLNGPWSNTQTHVVLEAEGVGTAALLIGVGSIAIVHTCAFD